MWAPFVAVNFFVGLSWFSLVQIWHQFSKAFEQAKGNNGAGIIENDPGWI
jgi:hypothetical protein